VKPTISPTGLRCDFTLSIAAVAMISGAVLFFLDTGGHYEYRHYRSRIYGLSAAFALQKLGHTVTVYEKDRQPGGLAIGYQERNGNGHWKNITTTG